MELPRIILAWNPPDFNTTAFQSYNVVDDIGNRFMTTNTSYELDLEREDVNAIFAVFAQNAPHIIKDGAKKFCYVDTLKRRYGEF